LVLVLAFVLVEGWRGGMGFVSWQNLLFDVEEKHRPGGKPRFFW
jgi:hypothetical protein